MERAKITVFDTTLRDGEQSPGCSMNQQEKLRLARQLDRLGVDVIEAGFPIASDGDFGAVRSIAAEIRRPVICGLARACDKDIQRAADALNGARGHASMCFWRLPIFIFSTNLRFRGKNVWSRRYGPSLSPSHSWTTSSFLRKTRPAPTLTSSARCSALSSKPAPLR